MRREVEGGKGKEKIVVGETKDVEGIDSDIGIVFTMEEGDGEIEIITKSTKIGERREKGEESGEKMKEREAGIAGEECGRVTIGSSAWPLLNSSILKASSPLAVGFKLLFLFFVLRLILLMERLIL